MNENIDENILSQRDMFANFLKTNDIGKQHDELRKRCRLATEFEKLNTIGEGSYGVVYRAKNKKTNEIVALKRIVRDKTNRLLRINSIREISILFETNHKNIIKLSEVVISPNLESIFLVMEFCEQDISTLLSCMNGPFDESQVKCIMLQLYKGLSYLHSNEILHRDLSTSNILMTDQGVIKIGDFGMARKSSTGPMTVKVVSLWYRPPELLLDCKTQTFAIDIWATGCIFAELLKGKPLLPGDSEIHQLNLMIDLLGTPTEEVWPKFNTLPALEFISLKTQPYNNLRSLFPDLSISGLTLLNSMFLYDPEKRATVFECLESRYFKQAPHPSLPQTMPTIDKCKRTPTSVDNSLFSSHSDYTWIKECRSINF